MLPETDPITSQSNVRCMNFVRTITDRDRNCVGGNQPAEQVCPFFSGIGYEYISV